MKIIFTAAAALFSLSMAYAQTDDMASDMKEQCVKEWQGDFAMQEYCLARQMKSFVAMHDVYKSERSEDEDLILYSCLDRWPRGHGYDWPMVKYCYERQNGARLRLNGE